MSSHLFFIKDDSGLEEFAPDAVRFTGLPPGGTYIPNPTDVGLDLCALLWHWDEIGYNIGLAEHKL